MFEEWSDDQIRAWKREQEHPPHQPDYSSIVRLRPRVIEVTSTVAFAKDSFER